MPVKPVDLLSQANPRCTALHLGLWACQARWLKEAVSAIRCGIWRPLEPREAPARTARVKVLGGDGSEGSAEPPAPGGYYPPPVNDIALISLAGPLMKIWSKFGGTNTVWVRQALRAAVADPAVRAILLRIDSPGGTVAGTEELLRDVRNANAKKPVFAHFDDLGASAAYLVALGARRLSANRTAEVGSIGTLAVIEDTSGAAKAEGLVVHVVSTGPRKGDFADGAPVTPEMLASLKEKIDFFGQWFFDEVAQARGLEGDRLKAVLTGDYWPAPQAKKLGLLDAVQSFDETVAELADLLADRDARAARMRKARLAAAGG